jgi:hypothetical protein
MKINLNVLGSSMKCCIPNVDLVNGSSRKNDKRENKENSGCNAPN